jgi:hypothetical protein
MLPRVAPIGRASEISEVVPGTDYLEPATFVVGETRHFDGGQGVGTEGRLSD